MYVYMYRYVVVPVYNVTWCACVWARTQRPTYINKTTKITHGEQPGPLTHVPEYPRSGRAMVVAIWATCLPFTTCSWMARHRNNVSVIMLVPTGCLHRATSDPCPATEYACGTQTATTAHINALEPTRSHMSARTSLGYVHKQPGELP